MKSKLQKISLIGGGIGLVGLIGFGLYQLFKGPKVDKELIIKFTKNIEVTMSGKYYSDKTMSSVLFANLELIESQYANFRKEGRILRRKVFDQKREYAEAINNYFQQIQTVYDSNLIMILDHVKIDVELFKLSIENQLVNQNSDLYIILTGWQDILMLKLKDKTELDQTKLKEIYKAKIDYMEDIIKNSKSWTELGLLVSGDLFRIRLYDYIYLKTGIEAEDSSFSIPDLKGDDNQEFRKIYEEYLEKDKIYKNVVYMILMGGTGIVDMGYSEGLNQKK